MTKTPPDFAIVTGILVKNSHGQVLLVKKALGVGPYPGTYLTPGGGVRPGESADDAVQRELYEETGVTATAVKRVLFDDDVTTNWKGVEKHFIMLLYVGEYVSGDLKPTVGNDDVFDDVGWFAPAEVLKLPLSPPLRKLIGVVGTWKGKFVFPTGYYVGDSDPMLKYDGTDP